MVTDAIVHEGGDTTIAVVIPLLEPKSKQLARCSGGFFETFRVELVIEKLIGRGSPWAVLIFWQRFVFG